MSASSLGAFIQVGFDILNSTVNPVTKKILLQIGSVTGQTVDSDAVEHWQHYGVATRPPKPQAGKAAAQAVVLRTGDHDIALATQDLRGLELYANLDYGEACLYSAGEDGNGQARVLLKKDGSINLYTRKGNTSAGAGMVVQVDAQNGAIRALNDLGFGIIADASGVTLTSGSASLTLKADGSVDLVGTGKTTIDGSGVVCGASLTGTGVATMESLTPLLTALAAQQLALTAFFTLATNAAIAVADPTVAYAAPIAASCATITGLLSAVPALFSTKTVAG